MLKSDEFEFLTLRGDEARPYAEQIGLLRTKVFWEFPYLYEGTIEYEKKYLETYFKAKNSFILLVKTKAKYHSHPQSQELTAGEVIGATTGIWAQEEEDDFRQPFIKHGIDPENVFYFGESIISKEYRGQGLGKIFFHQREEFARSLGFIEYLSFCAVVREVDHPLRPKDYKPLDSFWQAQGFHREEGLVTSYKWKDRDQFDETKKLMQYWLKKI